MLKCIDGYQREIDEEQNRRLHIERKLKEATSEFSL